MRYSGTVRVGWARELLVAPPRRPGTACMVVDRRTGVYFFIDWLDHGRAIQDDDGRVPRILRGSIPLRMRRLPTDPRHLPTFSLILVGARATSTNLTLSHRKVASVDRPLTAGTVGTCYVRTARRTTSSEARRALSTSRPRHTSHRDRDTRSPAHAHTRTRSNKKSMAPIRTAPTHAVALCTALLSGWNELALVAAHVRLQYEPAAMR